LQHAQALTEKSQAVLDGSMPLTAWLPHVPAAVAAIAFGPHRDLVKLVLLVISSAAASAVCGRAPDDHGTLHTLDRSPDDETAQPSLHDQIYQGASIVLKLLQHPVQSVQSKAWAAIGELLEGGAQESSHVLGLLRLLSSQPVMRHIVVDCLARDEEHEGVVVEALQRMLASGDGSTLQGTPRLLSCNAAHLKFIKVRE
jgi:hypothetical protein